MRRRSLTLLTLSTLFVGAGCARAGAPQRAAIPRRVVALAPNLTEIVFAVGAGDRLVGVSDYSDYPPAARAIPRVGGLEVSPERVASLSPDLVLATPEGNAKGPVTALAAAGVPVLVVPGGSLDDVLHAIDMIARRLGKTGEGERLMGALTARREAVRRARPAPPLPVAAMLIWPDPPQGAGAGTFLNDVLAEAGATNALGDRPGWPLVSEEWLATTRLDVLVLPDSDQTRAAYDRALASGPLSRGMVARARRIRIDESELTRPGPRVFDALERLAAALREPQPDRTGAADAPRERR
jgi:iron complex transport system substrate-binding protein